MMRCLIAFVVVVFAASSQAQQRVVSINMCADQLLLLLSPPENIVSVSYLSADPQYSDWTEEAVKYPLNYAKAEEIVTMRPDLVLAGQYSDPMVIRLLVQQNIPVYQLTRPQKLEHLFDETLAVGEKLNQSVRAAVLVSEWRQNIDLLQARGSTGKKPRMAIIGPNGFTQGAGSLRDQMLQKAGIINVAAQLDMTGNSEFTLEQIITQQPDLIALEDSTENHNSLAQRLLDHPAIKNLTSSRVSLPANLWSCSGPSYVKALQALIDAKLAWQSKQGKYSES